MFADNARVYTRECHENKTTRFWATYGNTRTHTFIIPVVMVEKMRIPIGQNIGFSTGFSKYVILDYDIAL